MQIFLQDLAQSLLLAGEFAVPKRLPHVHPDDWRLMGNQAWGAILAAGPAATAFLMKKGAATALATFFSMFLVVVAPFLKRLDNRGKYPSTANVHYGLININAQGLSSICLVSGVLGLGYCLFVLLKT